MPIQSMSPSATRELAGGVSEKPTRATERSNPFTRPSSRTVEGTLIHGTSAAFAGGRKNVSLGRSVSSVGGSSHAGVRTGDNRCPLDAEEGNVVSMRKAHALFAETPKQRSTLEDTSFTRSRDPCTSIVTLRRRKPWEVARSVRYRGRANLRKQEEPTPGSERTDACAARRASPLLVCVRASREGRA